MTNTTVIGKEVYFIVITVITIITSILSFSLHFQGKPHDL